MYRDPTVFIVDDDDAFRESLAVLLLAMGMRSKTYSSGGEFLANFYDKSPGCIILDVRMPVESGLVIQEKLAAFSLCPPVIILTGHADVPVALRAMKQGAVEFLQKTFTENEFRDAVQRAIALDLEQRVEYDKAMLATQMLDRLTRVERDVLNLVLAGYPNKRIATTLGASLRAIEDRRARVMKKLAADSLPELVRVAMNAGLTVDEQRNRRTTCVGNA